MKMPGQLLFTFAEMLELSGVLLGTLQSWFGSRGIIVPERPQTVGKGKRRYYTLRDVYAARLLGIASIMGLPPGLVGKAIIEYLAGETALKRVIIILRWDTLLHKYKCRQIHPQATMQEIFYAYEHHPEYCFLGGGIFIDLGKELDAVDSILRNMVSHQATVNVPDQENEL